MLSMTTDFQSDTGCPRPALEAIARTGFTHVHWCHHWNDDHIYTKDEIDRIEGWLRGYGLAVRDLHASAGNQHCWCSAEEKSRRPGVELVANRIEMASRLGADVIILHAPMPAPWEQAFAEHWRAAMRSLDILRPLAKACSVRIAFENGNYAVLEALLGGFEPELVGLCYDSGHGNLDGGLDWLPAHASRLIAIHLHDNDGRRDLHKIPMTGTVDWPRLAEVVAGSGYRKGITCEATMANQGIADAQEWLAQAKRACEEVQGMVDSSRGRPL